MKTTFLALITGSEQPGLMGLLADKTTELGGVWLDCKLSSVDDLVAGIIKIELPTENVENLKAYFCSQEKITVSFEPAGVSPVSERAPLDIKYDSKDRPGILRDITRTLKDLDVYIESAESHRVAVATLGRTLFTCTMRLRPPAGVDASLITARLETIDEDSSVSSV